MKRNHIILPCVIGIAICLLIAGIEARITAASINTWYHSLNKPFFNPPAWIFAPVWSVLYIMLGIVSGLIWSVRKKNTALFTCFFIQLLLNFLWSFLFFGAQAIGWALVNIVLLWSTLCLTLYLAWQRFKTVFYWLLPYFIWISFATILNFSLWILNE
jgi:translocator protein